LGYVGRSTHPIFTYPELLEWARVQARRDPKYKRIFKAKRYFSIKKRGMVKDSESASSVEFLSDENDQKDYLRLTLKEIARIESQPKRLPDPLEPRPWLSWSDCHVTACVAPADPYLRWFDNCSFSEMEDNGDTYLLLDSFDESMAGHCDVDETE
jgi:hypothetical protein